MILPITTEVRNAAMMLLKVIKRLDFELKEELKDGAVRVYDVLREHGNEVDSVLCLLSSSACIVLNGGDFLEDVHDLAYVGVLL